MRLRLLVLHVLFLLNQGSRCSQSDSALYFLIRKINELGWQIRSPLFYLAIVLLNIVEECVILQLL